MNDKVSTFRARDMREALQQVKDALGADAVILSTRSLREKGGAFIEVTACPNPNAGGPVPPPADTPPPRSRFSAVADTDTPPPRSRFSAVADDAPPSLAGRSAVDRYRRQRGQGQTASAPAPGSGLAADLSTIRNSLAELEAKVNTQAALEPDMANLDMEGKKRYSYLLMHGVEEPIARKLAVVDKGEKERGLEGALKRFLKFRDPMESQSRVIALVGPTGVGKTTTLAKIAAELLLNRRRTVGMITLDTFRVGAVAQLETYAKLLQVRLMVARTLSEVKAGLHSLSNCDFILVDTVGSSPYNRRQVNSTGSLLPVMGEDREVLLCMAGNVRETEQQAIFRRFSALSPTGLIFTKLDETVTYGGILNVALRARLPLTLYTDGQRVPENLGWLSAQTMAGWFDQPKVPEMDA
ncbi:MAG: flagellar biosynthesis protein FlhF [Magnetococcales bacterium]|nr:flagellar biosynthesis protein FlhF [Magnetococcales bacterium]